MSSSELTELEKAIEKVVEIFFKCAAHEGNKSTLTTSEFKELVNLQLPNLMKVGTSGGGKGTGGKRGRGGAPGLGEPGGVFPPTFKNNFPPLGAFFPSPFLSKNVGDLDEKMRTLDVNNDQELKFGEYWRLIGELAKEIKKEKAGKKK